MTDTTTRGRILRWAAYGAVPLVALAIAYIATRGSGDAAAPADSGRTAGAPTAQPVMLSADQSRRIGVTYALASVASLAREIRTVGQVTYDETRVKSVSLKVDGWVEELFANFTGQSLAKGAPLLAIYSPSLVTAQEELLLARRLEGELSGGTPEARANAASLVGAARRRLAYWDVPPTDIARIERSGQVQRTLTLRSPVSGFIVEKNVLQGARVMAGEPLYRIADLGTVWVEGEVFERDLPAVRTGQVVQVDVEALAGRTRSGRITYISPTLDPETRTVRVRVELPNPGFQLKPGMYATLTWRGTGSRTLGVPRTAVVSTGQRNIVFVRRPDGMLEPRIVTIGASTSDRIEILRGLSDGETVVKSATFLVDAESNLSTLLGGMGDMPGMDMTAPVGGGAAKPGPKPAPGAPARPEQR